MRASRQCREVAWPCPCWRTLCCRSARACAVACPCWCACCTSCLVCCSAALSSLWCRLDCSPSTWSAIAATRATSVPAHHACDSGGRKATAQHSTAQHSTAQHRLGQQWKKYLGNYQDRAAQKLKPVAGLKIRTTQHKSMRQHSSLSHLAGTTHGWRTTR